MEKYCVLGSSDGYIRYGVLEHGCVVSVQISLPDGQEVPTPHPLRFSRKPAEAAPVKRYLFNNPLPVEKHNGEQPRRPTWRRAGKREAA